MVREPLSSLHLRDCTDLDRVISASTESLWTRGESPVNIMISGGTAVTCRKRIIREGIRERKGKGMILSNAAKFLRICVTNR